MKLNDYPAQVSEVPQFSTDSVVVIDCATAEIPATRLAPLLEANKVPSEDLILFNDGICLLVKQQDHYVKYKHEHAEHFSFVTYAGEVDFYLHRLNEGSLNILVIKSSPEQVPAIRLDLFMHFMRIPKDSLILFPSGFKEFDKARDNYIDQETKTVYVQ